MIWVLGTLAFLFAAPTVTRVRKDPNLFLLIVYGFFLLMAEVIGSFSALGDVPKAESFFPNVAPGEHCGYSWWYGNMAICLTPLLTNALSLTYELFRWMWIGTAPEAENPVMQKDLPGNF